MNSIITVLASAVSIFSISMQGFAQSLGSREDEIAIRGVIVDMTDGFNNHDDGSTEPPHSELSIRVFQKDNGIWRVIAFHNTTVAASFKRD
jgi:hypothetical protein